jgi:hypothetical protein
LTSGRDGFWTAPGWRWRPQGDGCDLASLRSRSASDTEAAFSVGDIAQPGTIPATGRYTFVSVMNVLLHVVDEGRFDAAVGHVAASVAPGGWLLLAEPALALAAPVTPERPGASSVARPLSRYLGAFEAAGLGLVAVGASTVVAANPIERGDPAFRRFSRAWVSAARWARRGPRWADATGRLLSVVDRVLMRTGRAPSGKLILLRRASAGRGLGPPGRPALSAAGRPPRGTLLTEPCPYRRASACSRSTHDVLITGGLSHRCRLTSHLRARLRRQGDRHGDPPRDGLPAADVTRYEELFEVFRP